MHLLGMEVDDEQFSKNSRTVNPRADYILAVSCQYIYCLWCALNKKIDTTRRTAQNPSYGLRNHLPEPTQETPKRDKNTTKHGKYLNPDPWKSSNTLHNNKVMISKVVVEITGIGKEKVLIRYISLPGLLSSGRQLT